MKIAILGTRGIPASYSGFETSVQETAIRFVQRGIDTAVYCRKHHYQERFQEVQGISLIYIPSIHTKHLDTLTHTLVSTIHALFKGYDLILLYGIGNAIFIPVFRLFGKPVISVVDGADWARKKWGPVARACLSASRAIAAFFANRYVVDNEILANDYQQRFRRAPDYIPYGANTDYYRDEAVLAKYGLEKGEYVIFVGRFVKEKGIEFLIENFQKITTDRKLVVIGGNSIDPEYEATIKSTNDPRIVFLGFLYGEKYEALLHHARFYVSGSFLEGTSPSLLSAMVVNGFALVSDLPENREVLKGTCATFKTGDSRNFIEKMRTYLDEGTDLAPFREATRSIVSTCYSWDRITDQYLSLFDAVVKS